MKDYFDVYKDFPKEGISFLDINSVLLDTDKRSELKMAILKSNSIYLESKVDKVIAIESRGFLFGGYLADYLMAGLVLVRKPGKLPGEVVSHTYDTEYSKDTLEIQLKSIKPGDKVIIHDDILATGGTALAAATLVRKLGGEVIGFSFLGEIEAINASPKLKELAPVNSMIKF
jgi:adenine phosphoribosyltransferase